jgi:DNA-binding MarR family transcriptional regulator
MDSARIPHARNNATQDDAVPDAVLTATRLLMTVSTSSIAAVDDSITIPQFRVLVVLQSRGPMAFARLAEILDVDVPTITRTVDHMVAKGLLNRTGQAERGDEAELELTTTGNAVCTEVTQQRRAQIAEIVSRIPDEQRTLLGDAAEAFIEAGGEPPATEIHAAWR